MNVASIDSEWCVLDLETTGLFPNGHDRVVEIALVVVDAKGASIAEWHSLVNPNRDLGPTSVHGITADLANQAPSFSELIGDILQVMDGRRLVAHNASFDERFLSAEFRRAGYALAELDALCTMQIASALGLGRTLEACCATAGIKNSAPHMALGDARAAAELLSYLLRLQNRGEAWPVGARIPVPVATAGAARPSGKALARNAASKQATPTSYLSRLAGRLPTPMSPAGVSAAAVADYSGLLDQVLEDRVVTGDELASLATLARQWELGPQQIAEINLRYMRGLVSIALADGVVTQAERHDLERAGALLGIDAATLDSLLLHKTTDDASIVPGSGCEFDGMTVCFTGSSSCFVNGARLSRASAADMATAAGLTVVKGVTKTLDLLVVADADTQSGKAKTARKRGTRIIAERSFWPRVGVSVD